MNNQAHHTFQNFDLLIEPSDAGYCSRILFSQSGQGKCSFLLPFSAQELQEFLYLPEQCIHALRLAHRQTESTTPLTPQSFGERLFDAAFAGDVGIGLRRSLDVAYREGAGLRIRLRLDDKVPELAELPWEYLYVQLLNRFLLLSNRTVLVRYLEIAQQPKPLQVTPPLHILTVISDPKDIGARLNFEAEWTGIKKALLPLTENGLITIERLSRATLPELQYRLQQTPSIHILHFMGHGDFDDVDNIGRLIWEDEDGRALPVDATKLTTLLQDHLSLRLIFLNACQAAVSGSFYPFAGVAQRLIRQGIPAIIAMQNQIGDKAAIALAESFYGAIVNGFPVDAALAEARKRISIAGNEQEWATPVLFSRAEDNQLLVISEEELYAHEHVQTLKIICELVLDGKSRDVPSEEFKKAVREANLSCDKVDESISSLKDNEFVELEYEHGAELPYSIKLTTLGFEMYAERFIENFEDRWKHILLIIVNKQLEVDSKIVEYSEETFMFIHFILHLLAKKQYIKIEEMMTCMFVSVAPRGKRFAKQITDTHRNSV